MHVSSQRLQERASLDRFAAWLPTSRQSPDAAAQPPSRTGSPWARPRSTSASPRARSGSGRTSAGCPPSTRPGGHRRYRRGDLETFLKRSAAPAGARRTGRSILIVDDDDRLREFVRVNLEMEGYLVREAAASRQGLAALEEEPPDLILLDVMMPQVDGWEMLRRVQERHGVGAIPVVMFSGKVDEQTLADAESARRAGLHRQAVQPAAADRVDEAAPPRLAAAPQPRRSQGLSPAQLLRKGLGTARNGRAVPGAVPHNDYRSLGETTAAPQPRCSQGLSPAQLLRKGLGTARNGRAVPGAVPHNDYRSLG